MDFFKDVFFINIMIWSKSPVFGLGEISFWTSTEIISKRCFRDFRAITR